LDHTVWAQQEVLSQDSLDNSSTQIANRLNTIIELLEQARYGNIIQLYFTMIIFMMGLAFVIFGLYIGQEQKLSVFTKRLYTATYFALVIPVTILLVGYISNTLLSGVLDDPVLFVAILLFIPVMTSYILMIAKIRYDIVRHS
jgi:hypothetical protein